MASIKELEAQGGYAADGLVDLPVIWVKDDGSVFEFVAKAKSAPSAADWEFINFNRQAEQSSIMARRVHRLVRFDDCENGILPLPQCEKLKPELLLAICTSLIKAHEGYEKEAEAAKKPSGQKKSSGTT